MNVFAERHQIKGISYILVLLVTTVILFLTLTSHVTADSSYRTITVEKGDTLWSIAQEYHQKTPGLSNESFIEWVENKNGLVRNHIELNQKLIIPVAQ
ncbi:LysM peptidoglycan-binding domain-containing protein [Sporolactobacillus shoreae]|uniref:LysM peptidoglycan-binding domain-containing protein n=1 Tax=Sporolactobacillus shoreae TaxID=1465501 RepID=A0A4Z0GTU9_9BACL|nr:LysM peptidoglycan-binding domain-containing protein [Sporolactobacillus shoreae]TGB00401.1 LysM peptidoglycan-binding domain-containing protein [Sporolactobacillus shoreae]